MDQEKYRLGKLGESAVEKVLVDLVESGKISGFLKSENIFYYGRNFQIDFLLFVPKIGLVVLEVKNWQGEIIATSDDQWIQCFSSCSNNYYNASKQVLRTSGLLLQILEKAKMNKFPIRSIVVFSDDNTVIVMPENDSNKLPQTDVIMKSMLPKWIIDNYIDNLVFDIKAEDKDRMNNIIREYTKSYKIGESSNEYLLDKVEFINGYWSCTWGEYSNISLFLNVNKDKFTGHYIREEVRVNFFGCVKMCADILMFMFEGDNFNVQAEYRVADKSLTIYSDETEHVFYKELECV